MSARKPRLVMFERRPTPHVFSIEQVFDVVRSELPGRFDVHVAVSSWRSTGVFPRIRSVVEARGRQGDVNHVVGDVSYLALSLDPARTIVTIHDCEFMVRASAPKRAIYGWVWLRLPVWRARIVTVPTDDVRRDLERYQRFDPRKVRVIPDPVAPVFSPTERPFRAERPVILQVGTRSNKNLERVADALEGVPCHLVVLGPMSRAQRDLLERRRVSFESLLDLTQHEVADRYRDCDLVVFASTKEGFGLPVVEAQASGRPVVTSDRAPLTDVAGGAACLVDPLDVASIRAGIRRVIDDATYRERLVRDGLRNVTRFSAGSVAQRYTAIYDEILAAVPASAP
jgi:glycosyltransferase involved in cell wall biosynthesis